MRNKRIANSRRLPMPVLWIAAAVLSAQAAWAADFALLDDRTVQDQAGRILTVRKPFQRIISLYGAHTENLFSLGAGDQVVGVARNDTFPPPAAAKPAFSYHDDPEKLMAARPDLVLVRPMIDRGYPRWTAALQRAGITVVSLQPSTIEELFAYWKILGTLTGRRPQAQDMIAHFRKTTAALAELGRSVAEPKSVYFEAIHSKMKTFAPDSMAIFALETAGGVNVAADARPVRRTNIAAYGKERILSRADAIDVYLAQYGTMNRPTVATIRGEPGFQAIKAVRENRIYLIDEKIVSRPTLRLLEGIYEIGGRLYPQVFSPAIKPMLAMPSAPQPQSDGVDRQIQTRTQ